MSKSDFDNQDEQVSRALGAWQPKVNVPANFRAGVWSRIASRQEARDGAWWRRLLQWGEGWLANPQYAVVVAVFAVLLGTGLGTIRASVIDARLSDELQQRYVVSVDPFARSAAMQGQ